MMRGTPCRFVSSRNLSTSSLVTTFPVGLVGREKQTAPVSSLTSRLSKSIWYLKRLSSSREISGRLARKKFFSSPTSEYPMYWGASGRGIRGPGGLGRLWQAGRARGPRPAQPQRSAKLSSTALCAQPGRANVHHCDGQHVADVRTAARPARPPPCPRHSRRLWRSRAAAWLCRGF